MVFKSVLEQRGQQGLPHLTHTIQLISQFISRGEVGQKGKKSWEKIWCASDLRHVQQQQLLKK